MDSKRLDVRFDNVPDEMVGCVTARKREGAARSLGDRLRRFFGR
ncbi:hypothetical protein Natpe_1107 [Natrinema pellirubrum DSM 15624]|uniref:Uncharacterized protein n=1 Tax=Natrinema pellirubrum (strain DSM 15624 / CIP 106293 / JCM 10476 / NCIMB 786 / 157) TaxID=797303 RepID=L0JI86_NATP1|nr:hypothetical protein Natpe_1107 [Natrinema pellirubrum DSM 15624]